MIWGMKTGRTGKDHKHHIKIDVDNHTFELDGKNIADIVTDFDFHAHGGIVTGHFYISDADFEIDGSIYQN